MRVYLRCRKVGMSQEFFYCVEVGAVVEHRRGEAVPDGVRAAAVNRLCELQVAVHYVVHHLGV